MINNREIRELIGRKRISCQQIIVRAFQRDRVSLSTFFRKISARSTSRLPYRVLLFFFFSFFFPAKKKHLRVPDRPIYVANVHAELTRTCFLQPFRVLNRSGIACARDSHHCRVASSAGRNAAREPRRSFFSITFHPFSRLNNFFALAKERCFSCCFNEVIYLLSPGSTRAERKIFSAK